MKLEDLKEERDKTQAAAVAALQVGDITQAIALQRKVYVLQADMEIECGNMFVEKANASLQFAKRFAYVADAIGKNQP